MFRIQDLSRAITASLIFLSLEPEVLFFTFLTSSTDLRALLISVYRPLDKGFSVTPFLIFYTFSLITMGLALYYRNDFINPYALGLEENSQEL